MSLQIMLAAHDDKALEALSSKGLARRARRDTDAGKVQIVSTNTAYTEVLSDGQTVEIDAKGPLTAQCTCSATGLCRHVLSAIMHLRNLDTSSDSIVISPDTLKPSENENIPPQPSARDELLEMSDRHIIKFAGADLAAALGLAESIDLPKINEEGLNLQIELPDSPVVVTFIAGQHLKGAAYKGPKTKARMVTAACAILVRRMAGLKLDTQKIDLPETNVAQLSPDDLSKMLLSITRAMRAVLTGVPAIAADNLFDQAIAARVQTAPRLTAQLRGLAKQATLATSRHIDYDPVTFLENAANCYALCQAMAQTPRDINLTGSLKRTYNASEPLKLWMMGARSWRNVSGARGLTCYGYAPETHEWYETTTARGAGMDLSFSTDRAYEGTLWQAGTPHAMMGRTVHLPKPSISDDLQISQTVSQAGQLGERLTMNALEIDGSLVSNWSDLRRNIAKNTGAGIRRKTLPFPVLIKPDKHLDLSFDEVAQIYKWGIVDQDNEVIYLNISAKDTEIAQRIQSLRRKISAVLIAVRFEGFDIVYEPVSIFLNYKSAITVFNIGLDRIEYRRLLGRVKPNLSDFFPQFTSPQAVDHKNSTELLDTILDTLLDVAVSSARTERLEPLAQKCEQAGLATLATAIANVQENSTEDNILKATYLLNEIRHLLSLET